MMIPSPVPTDTTVWNWEQPDGRSLDVAWCRQDQGQERSDSPAVVLVHGEKEAHQYWVLEHMLLLLVLVDEQIMMLLLSHTKMVDLLLYNFHL